jgi:uncharacterized glyoxalase superfamily protein PhnB
MAIEPQSAMVYLIVRNASRALDFHSRAFGATEQKRFTAVMTASG